VHTEEASQGGSGSGGSGGGASDGAGGGSGGGSGGGGGGGGDGGGDGGGGDGGSSGGGGSGGGDGGGSGGGGGGGGGDGGGSGGDGDSSGGGGSGGRGGGDGGGTDGGPRVATDGARRSEAGARRPSHPAKGGPPDGGAAQSGGCRSGHLDEARAAAGPAREAARAADVWWTGDEVDPSSVARRFPSFFAFADGRRACRASSMRSSVGSTVVGCAACGRHLSTSFGTLRRPLPSLRCVWRIVYDSATPSRRCSAGLAAAAAAGIGARMAQEALHRLAREAVKSPGLRRQGTWASGPALGGAAKSGSRSFRHFNPDLKRVRGCRERASGSWAW
jgi:hypothetical protein